MDTMNTGTRMINGYFWVAVQQDDGTYHEHAVTVEASEPCSLPMGSVEAMIGRIIGHAHQSGSAEDGFGQHPEQCQLSVDQWVRSAALLASIPALLAGSS